MKSSLSRALSKRREAANRRIISAKEQLQNKESVSKGRREIVIEPSCSEVCAISNLHSKSDTDCVEIRNDSRIRFLRHPGEMKIA